ncbi:MAG TPA: HAMP domain-containing sensor histidine kinase [Candidatus Angelobacter sp.]|nr:HAMP domain-containing sensor histidine kinase [Candidatus Angelobacter sp.]
MKLPSKERFLSTAVIVALAAVLVVLAMLQYRWSGEVSEATAARMENSLRGSMSSFSRDLYRELTNVCFAFQPDMGPAFDQDHARYIQHFQEWSKTAQHAGLVENVFLWQDAAGKRPRSLRLNVTSGQLEPVDWPVPLEALRAHLEMMSASIQANLNHRGASDIFRVPGFMGGPRDHRTRDHQPSSERRFRPHGNPLFLWHIDESIPALVRPVIHRRGGQNGQAEVDVFAIDWVVVKLDGKFLREHVISEIANQYFGPEGLPYQVAIIGGGGPGHVIYSSDTQFGEQDVSSADVALNVFGPPHDHHPPMDVFTQRPGTSNNSNESKPAPVLRSGVAALPGPQGLEPIRYSDGQTGWLLIARNRKGSLDAVVAGLRSRNLALSFGVLLLLAASMGMIIIASQRAQKLARLQMDFVAAISHELRTPLAVICSAADNITDGLVEGREQLTKYGNVIKNQGQQLNQLVEQILLFAATRQSGNLYNFRPLQVSEILDAALHNTTGLIQAQQVVIEKHIEPNLPEITGDLSAFSQCLQNLITNAVKYGGPQPWIGIRACLDKGSQGKEIQISIEDKGMGIAPAELDHIFEPFYRSPAVTSAQIHGTGLGLPLAQRMAEAMGAKLTVSSVPGQGSIFTLHVPATQTGAATTGVAMKADPKYS